MATVTTIDKTYDIPESILSQYEVKPVPVIDRMQCLRGEYDIELHPIGKGYYWVDGTTIHENMKSKGSVHTDNPYFPNKELAEEYLLIAEGKWLPKKNDEYCACDSIDCTHGWTDKLALHISSETYTEKYRVNNSYFPSFKQMESYIAKNKPVRPLVGKEVKLTVDGTEYKATLQ
jgi:hypothetical protein